MTNNRHRGGQPGNHNARTSGFYSKAVPPERLHKLEDAAEVRGLDQEIALLRSKIAIAGENSEDYQVLVPGINLLSRLLNTSHKLGYDKEEGLKNAIQNVWRQTLPGGLEPVEAYRILSAHLAQQKAAANAIKANNVEGEKPFESEGTNGLP